MLFTLTSFFILAALSPVNGNLLISADPSFNRARTPAKKVSDNTSASGIAQRKQNPDDPIDIGKRPLSNADLDKVMKWIAVKVSAQKLPFCWKREKARGTGVPLSGCSSGTEKNGELCYPTCRAGFAGAGPVCWQTCPVGFTDIGAFCQKPAAYGRGAGYVVWDEAKCKNENSQGCEMNGALWYPRCRAGFRAVGSNICSPVCPQGLEDSGTGCTKQSYGRGVGTTQSCRPGLEKSGLLCYPACDAAFPKGEGPLCWQKCPSQLPTDCVAGCAKDTRTCALKIYEQTSSVAKVALNLASFGSGGKVVDKLDNMLSITDEIAGIAQNSNGNVSAMLGPNATLEDVKKFMPAAGGGYAKIGTELTEKIINYANMFSSNFETLTTPEVAQMIDEKFSPEAAAQIKKEWAMRHLALNLQLNGFTAAKDLLWLASFGDPTGLADVANAFLDPKCDADTPFPVVTPL